MQKIVLVGSSGHAKVVLDVIRQQGRFTPIGFVDSYKPKGAMAVGLQILGGVEDLPGLVDTGGVEGVLVAIGDNTVRAKLTAEIRTVVPELPHIVAVHPMASVADGVTLGQGTVVMAGAVINSDSQIGEACIVNTRASLDHDGVLESYASLAPGACAGGNVRIGAYTAVGLGAMLIHGVTVGPHAVIGAGAVVVKDIPGHSVAFGNPCRVVRSRQEGDRYL